MINNLFDSFILSMEDSLNETNDKENTDENQRKTTKSSLEQQCTSHTTEFRTPSGNSSQNVDKFNSSNNSNKQMKKCGRCKQYIGVHIM